MAELERDVTNKTIHALEYRDFVYSIIQKIQNAQYESLKLVNKNLIQLYWDIGKEICEIQKKIWLVEIDSLRFGFKIAGSFFRQNWFLGAKFMAYEEFLCDIRRKWRCATNSGRNGQKYI